MTVKSGSVTMVAQEPLDKQTYVSTPVDARVRPERQTETTDTDKPQARAA
ncbi:unnamed protein product, partial [Ixodes pacificus]